MSWGCSRVRTSGNLVSAGGADYARGNKALEILNLSNNN